MNNGANPSLGSLQRGDSLELRSELETWLIRQVYNCTETDDGEPTQYRWVEYELEAVSGDAKAYLVAEFDDDEWVVTFFDRRLSADEVGYVRGDEFPDSLTVDDHRFPLYESVHMTVGKMNSTILWRGEFADYVSGERVISIEAYPDPTNTPRETELEIWSGREIEERSIVIYPAETPVPRQDLLTGQLESRPNTAVDRLRQSESFQPVERRYNTLTNSAQRKLVAGGVAAGVIFLIILLLLI